MVEPTQEARRGVTLIELLIVVVIIGLLVAFAVPRLTRNKERAVVASMRSDLRNLTTAQEGYYQSNSSYTTNPVALNVALSPGNVLTVNQATVSGWSATIANPLTTDQCYLFHGNATPVGSATSEGDIDCS